MKQWDDTWPAIRLETHYENRVVRCFTDRPKSLHALLANAAQRYPEHVALVCGNERLSWQAVHDLSARLAAGLTQRGVGTGDRVAMLVGNCNDLFDLDAGASGNDHPIR